MQAMSYVNMLDMNQMMPAALAVTAANLDLNANNIHLVGWQQSGLPYA